MGGIHTSQTRDEGSIPFARFFLFVQGTNVISYQNYTILGLLAKPSIGSQTDFKSFGFFGFGKYVLSDFSICPVNLCQRKLIDHSFLILLNWNCYIKVSE